MRIVQQRMRNTNITQQMMYLLPILEAFAGGMGTPSSGLTNTNQQGTTTSTGAGATTGTSATQTAGTSAEAGAVTPTLSPQEYALMQQIMGQAGAMGTPSLTGYQAAQTSGINANADLQSQAVNNIMASRGLSTSPAAATALAGVQQNRMNQITQMQEQIPMLKNQLALQNLAGVTGAFSAMPKGTTTSNVGQTTGQTAGQTAGTFGTTTSGTSSSTGRTATTGSQGGGAGGAAAGFAGGLLNLATIIAIMNQNKPTGSTFSPPSGTIDLGGGGFGG